MTDNRNWTHYIKDDVAALELFELRMQKFENFVDLVRDNKVPYDTIKEEIQKIEEILMMMHPRLLFQVFDTYEWMHKFFEFVFEISHPLCDAKPFQIWKTVDRHHTSTKAKD